MKPWVGNLALTLGGLVVGVALLEVGLRAADIEYPSFYRWDEYTGASLRPGAKGWWRKEGKAYIRIKRGGLRDREHTKEKLPHTVRIAVLGDSYAEALQVPLEDTFWSVLERDLSTC